MSDPQPLQDFQKLIDQLIECNRHVPVVVEGQRVTDSLRKLGLTGEILKLHGGKSLHDFCEGMAKRYPQFILLMDWDERGNDLLAKVGRHLETGWQEFNHFRTGFITLCGKNLQAVEELAPWFEALHVDAKDSAQYLREKH